LKACNHFFLPDAPGTGETSLDAHGAAVILTDTALRASRAATAQVPAPGVTPRCHHLEWPGTVPALGLKFDELDPATVAAGMRLNPVIV
jgi:hypothetical protein